VSRAPAVRARARWICGSCPPSGRDPRTCAARAGRKAAATCATTATTARITSPRKCVVPPHITQHEFARVCFRFGWFVARPAETGDLYFGLTRMSGMRLLGSVSVYGCPNPSAIR
jgi:hypothetical protein